MDNKDLFIGIMLAGIGLIFFYNNKNMAKGAAQFYAKIYTEKNMKIMFKIAGAILIAGGIFIAFFK